MLTYLRYTLATLCFAASVGCLALWGWTASHPRTVDCAMFNLGRFSIDTQVCNGEAKITPYRLTRARPAPSFRTAALSGVYLTQFELTIKSQGPFATGARSIYFPLWYPALVSALAGVGALRLGRRFTLRSAIIATTVVAGLLGMAVAL
jgi:hypothetical protein